MIATRSRLGRPSRIAIVAALCGAVLSTTPGAAQADPSEGVATTATHVIGFRGQLACGASGFFSELSDDRGATWRQGAECLPWDAAMPRVVDPSTGGVVYVNGNDIEGPDKPAPPTGPELIYVDPNTGARSWPTPVILDPARAVDSYAADNGAVYVVTNNWPDGVTPAYTLERYTGSTPTTCNVTLGGSAAWSVLSLAGAILVENRQGPAGNALLSTDGCQTWRDVTPPGDCDNFFYGNGWEFFSQCSTPSRVQAYDLRDPEVGWHIATSLLASNPLPSQSLGTYPYALDADDRHVHAFLTGDFIDRWSKPQLPAGWIAPGPVAPPPAATAPAPAAAGAFGIINGRYRRAMGLSDIGWSAQAATAAAAHAAYLVAHPPDDPLDAEEEDPDLSGFYGEDPDTRCDRAGVAGGSCDERFLPAVSDFTLAARVWMGRPDEGTDLLTVANVGLGSAASGTVADFPYDADGDDPLVFTPDTLIDLQAPVNGPGANIHVWPADGSTDVPVTWSGTPDSFALAGYAGDRTNIGPVLYVSGRIAADFALVGPEGVVPMFYSGDGTVANALHIDEEGEEWMPVLPTHKLQPGSDYTITITRSDDNVTQLLHFHTESSASAAQFQAQLVALQTAATTSDAVAAAAAAAKATGCTVKSRLVKAKGHRFLRWNRTGTCARKALVQRLSHKGVWKQVKQPLLVDPGEQVRWRARWIKLTVAHGTYKAPDAARGGKATAVAAARR